MKATLRRLIKKLIERGVRPYQLVNPNHRYGIDFIADIKRLAKAYKIDVRVAFDVGANIGKTSLAFRAAWPSVAIYAFEPSEAAALALRSKSAVHQPFFVEQLALGDRSGQATFHVYEGAPDLNSLHAKSPYVERFGVEGKVDTVEMTSLDVFCAARRVDRINVLKIDTEGSDYDVLVGAAGLLRERRIDFVYCEFNSLDEKLGSLKPIAELLGAYGYNFVASYNDYITTDGIFFAVSNALFAAPPSRDV